MEYSAYFPLPMRIARFRLHATSPGGIAAGMNARAACLLASALVFSSCEKPAEITVTESREATTRDGKPKLFATSDERFRDAKPSPVKGVTPEGWLVLPASQFRLLNYRFGASGTGETWVSVSAGTVLDNTNRWLGQFGAKELDADGLAKLPSVAIAGTTGVWVTAEGAYESGMGSPRKDGFALAGVVASVNGQILTVKMVGPKAEVEQQKAVLENYCRTLTMAE